MNEFSPVELDELFKAAPKDLFLGLSTISGDGVCLNRGLKVLETGERDLLITVMEQKGKVPAMKKIAGADIGKLVEVGRNIEAAMRKLRVAFDKASETYIPE